MEGDYESFELFTPLFLDPLYGLKVTFGQYGDIIENTDPQYD